MSRPQQVAVVTVSTIVTSSNSSTGCSSDSGYGNSSVSVVPAAVVIVAITMKFLAAKVCHCTSSNCVGNSNSKGRQHLLLVVVLILTTVKSEL